MLAVLASLLGGIHPAEVSLRAEGQAGWTI